MIEQLATTGLGSCIMLGAALCVIVGVIFTDRRSR